jgi:hypothetical protein
MRKPTLCILLGVLTTACQDQHADQQTTAPASAVAARDTPPAAPDTAAARARQWLVASIEDNFNTENKAEDNIEMRNGQSIYTRQYRDYKLDAIQLEYGGEEEEKAFLTKWQGRYNPKYVGQAGFLFSGQDNGQVKVTRCRLKERTKDKAFLFDVATRDVTYKIDAKGDIKVVETAEGFKIDDVLEY